MPCRSASVSLAKATSKRVAHPDQPRHRVGRRAVHPDLAVPIDRHEAEGRIDRIADDGRVEAIALDDRLPVAHAGAAQGIDADFDAGGADRLHVDDIAEVGDIGPDVIVAMHAGRLARAVIGDALDALQAVFEIAVGGALDAGGDVGIGRTAIGRIIFEAAILGRIVRRRDHDAVGEAIARGPCCRSGSHARSPASACSRRAASIITSTPLAANTSSALATAGSASAWVSMPTNSGPERSGALPVIAQRLADRQDMHLVERIVERGAAMPRGAERHPLRRHRRIGLFRRNRPSPAAEYSPAWRDRRACRRSGLILAATWVPLKMPAGTIRRDS